MMHSMIGLTKVVPAVSSSDAIYDWAGGAGAELMTTEASQLDCSHNAQVYAGVYISLSLWHAHACEIM